MGARPCIREVLELVKGKNLKDLLDHGARDKYIFFLHKQQHDEEITTTTVATDQSTGEEQQKTRDYCTFFFREDQQRRTAGQHEHELHRQACSVGERARTRAWVILQWQRRRFLVTGGATDELQWQQAADHHGQENQQPIDRGKVTWRTRRSP
ncbi:hypothetical protein CFC21_002834 [Triticum aestivum]|uniref:Uncharacterized protein n=1 Tax=Triticum aestivum TaxID=4565 RepID=A0A3B5Y376_WHEAT|nr:hypothetical protein CFC21_002834 [Triticum aestivum]